MSGHPEAGPDQTAARGRVRVVLAEDHQIVRRGLQLILEAEPDFEVVGQAGDIPSLRACVRELAPDVLILDLNMPGGPSLDVIPELRAEAPDTQIVVLTMEADTAFLRQARRAGALGYVLKESADSEIVRAVRAAATGEPYVNRHLAARLIFERALGEGPD
jgi:two-component system, NarL family, response regulator NreC